MTARVWRVLFAVVPCMSFYFCFEFENLRSKKKFSPRRLWYTTNPKMIKAFAAATLTAVVIGHEFSSCPADMPGGGSTGQGRSFFPRNPHIFFLFFSSYFLPLSSQLTFPFLYLSLVPFVYLLFFFFSFPFGSFHLKSLSHP